MKTFADSVGIKSADLKEIVVIKFEDFCVASVSGEAAEC